jgi:hypothetical protein
MGMTLDKHEAEQALIARYHANALQAAELQAAAQEQALEQARDGKLKDPGATARNAAVAGAVNIDKALILDGRPTVISSNQTPDELIRRMARALGFDVDSTAEEVAGELPPGDSVRPWTTS